VKAMTEDKMKITTGIEQLDKDISILFELRDSGKLKEIQKIIEQPELTTEKVFSVIPKEVIRLAVLVSQETNYSQVLEKCSEDGKVQLEEARDLLRNYLSQLINDRTIVRKVIDKIIEKTQKDEGPFLNLNSIISISSIPTLFPTDDGTLLPALRIGLEGKGGKVLLDTTLDWDDVLLVASGFLQALEKDFERWKDSANRGEISVASLSHSIADRLGEIRETFVELENNAAAYGISVKKVNKTAMQKKTNRRSLKIHLP